MPDGGLRRRLCASLAALWSAFTPLPLFPDVSIDTQTLQLVFDEQGSLVKAVACFPDCMADQHQRLRLEHAAGLISFGQARDQPWVQRRGLIGGAVDGDIQLFFTDSTSQSVIWTVSASGYRLEVAVSAAGPLTLSGATGFKPRDAAGFGSWLEQERYVALGEDGIRQIGLEAENKAQGRALWAGWRNRYWGLLAREESSREFSFKTGDRQQFPVVTLPGSLTGKRLTFYLGPLEPGELRQADNMLESLMFAGLWSWLRWICFGFYYLLSWIQSWIPSWGLAIMALSLAAHVLMLPLSLYADRLQQKVNATEIRLAPGLARIRQESSGEDQAQRILQFYKAENVHPLYSLKSLLGVALVVPVFIGAFDMLAENIHLLAVPFWWIRDLSRPDAYLQLPFDVPFFGSSFNLLPVLMTALSLVASALHHTPGSSREMHRRKTRNMWLLAALFFVLFYTFPAGMVLYWITNNLIAVCKGLWSRRRPRSRVMGA